MRLNYPDNYTPNIYLGDDCERYALGNDGKNVLFCISINPSVACDKYSDPTMNALVNISRKKGFDGCIMINPAPYRTPKPAELPATPDKCLKENIKIIRDLFSKHPSSTVLCAWGDFRKNGPKWFRKSLEVIMELAAQYGMKLVYIRKTRQGEPTYLSYLNRDHALFDNGKGNYELSAYVGWDHSAF